CFALAKDIEANQLGEALQVGLAEIHGFGLGALVVGDLASGAVFGGQLCGAGFDVFGDFGKRGSGVGGGKLQPVVLVGIVAGGGNVGAIEFAGVELIRRGPGRGGE